MDSHEYRHINGLLLTGTQSHLTVCEEDSIYDIRAKFYNHFPEKSGENIIWRKTESTVSNTNMFEECVEY